MRTVPVVVQPRHIHLSAADQVELFGADTTLTPLTDAGHKGQVVYRETVDIVGDSGTIKDVSIIGPARADTQVELSPSEAVSIGLNVPLRASGDLSRAARCVIRGPNEEIERACAIIPIRHLHCNESDANNLGVKQHDIISLEIAERDAFRIPHVLVRVHPTFQTAFHITADEAAQFWLHTGDQLSVFSD